MLLGITWIRLVADETLARGCGVAALALAAPFFSMPVRIIEGLSTKTHRKKAATDDTAHNMMNWRKELIRPICRN